MHRLLRKRCQVMVGIIDVWDAFWWEWISVCAEPCKHFSFTCRRAVCLVPCRIRSCTGLRSIARGFVPWMFLVWALLSFSPLYGQWCSAISHAGSSVQQLGCVQGQAGQLSTRQRLCRKVPQSPWDVSAPWRGALALHKASHCTPCPAAGWGCSRLQQSCSDIICQPSKLPPPLHLLILTCWACLQWDKNESMENCWFWNGDSNFVLGMFLIWAV